MDLHENNTELVYLDQSILDWHVKGKLSDLRDTLTGSGEAKAVYSAETMKEIARIEDSGDRQKFFDCLKELGAHYLTVDEFGKAYLSDSEPNLAFEKHLEGMAQFGGAIEPMEQLSYKMWGGRKGEDFASILQEGRTGFEGLMAYMKEQCDKLENELGEEAPGIVEAMDGVIDLLRFAHEEAVTGLDFTLNKYIENQETFDARKEFREDIEIGPQQLNNIKPPNVIPQIWELLKSSDKFPSDKIGMESFFGGAMLRICQSVSGKEPTLLQIVTGLYNLLNTIGYHSDREVEKERKFRSAISDQSHAGYAAYTDILASRDKRLVIKTVAAYEYLKIRTRILWVKSGAQEVQLADAVDVVSNVGALGL